MWLILLIISDLLSDNVSIPGLLYFGLVLVASLTPSD